jgi:hypothetical protein
MDGVKVLICAWGLSREALKLRIDRTYGQLTKKVVSGPYAVAASLSPFPLLIVCDFFKSQNHVVGKV